MSEWLIKVPELGLHQSFEGTPAQARAAAINQAKEWKCKIAIKPKVGRRISVMQPGKIYRDRIQIAAPDYWKAMVLVKQEKVGFSGEGERIPGTNADFVAVKGDFASDQFLSRADLKCGFDFIGRVKLPPMEIIDPSAAPPVIAHLLPPPDLKEIAKQNREIRRQNKNGRFGSLVVSRVDGQHTTWPNLELKSEYIRKIGGAVKDLVCTGPGGRRIHSTEILNEFIFQVTHRYRLMKADFYFSGSDFTSTIDLKALLESGAPGEEFSGPILTFDGLSQLIERSKFEQALATKFANLQAYPLYVHKSGEAPTLPNDSEMSGDAKYPEIARRIISFTARGGLISEEMSSLVETPAVLFFYSDWAPECRPMLPLLEELADRYRSVNFVAIDVDEYDEPWGLAGRNGDARFAFRIPGLPTMILMDAGAELERAIGITRAATLRAMIDRAAPPPSD